MNVNVNLSLILYEGTVAQKVKGSEFTLHTEFFGMLKVTEFFSESFRRRVFLGIHVQSRIRERKFLSENKKSNNNTTT